MISIIKKNLKTDLFNLIYIAIIIGYILDLSGMVYIAGSFPKPPANNEIIGFVQTVIINSSLSVSAEKTYAAGVITMFILLSGTILSGRIAGERNDNTMMRIYSTGISRIKIYLCFLLSAYIEILLIAIILITFSLYFLDINWGTSVWKLMFLILSGTAASVGISLFFSSVFKSVKASVTVNMVFVVLMSFFSSPFDPYRLGRAGFSRIVMTLTLNNPLQTGFVTLMSESNMSINSYALVLLSAGIIMTVSALCFSRKENFYENHNNNA